MAQQSVTGDLYESITGQLFEIGRQLRQPNGYPFDPLQLKVHLQAAIEGRFGAVSGNFRFDKRKDGWTLLENAPRRISGVIDAVPFLENGEPSVKGEVMATRAIKLNANYGQEDAEWLLENQDKISVELRNFVLVFTATVWRDPDGRRFVPCLDWFGGRWFLRFFWLDRVWSSDDRLAAPRNSLIPNLLTRRFGF
ncbi:MAG: hypothetical protein HY451_00375 [Parcubacteria group bacterium]|nr:hypothetical protein [Parcubacteria group bacterium]